MASCTTGPAVSAGRHGGMVSSRLGRGGPVLIRVVRASLHGKFMFPGLPCQIQLLPKKWLAVQRLSNLACEDRPKPDGILEVVPWFPMKLQKQSQNMDTTSATRAGRQNCFLFQPSTEHVSGCRACGLFLWQVLLLVYRTLAYCGLAERNQPYIPAMAPNTSNSS